jgi:pimeloyl-ACP methyl ester carboxylesterase
MGSNTQKSAFEIEERWIAHDYPEQRTFNETYGFAGSHGRVHVEAILMRPRDRPSRTLLFFMHPTTPMDVLPVPRALLAMGFHVLCGRNRYFRSDPVVIFEKLLLDFGAWIRYAKERLGYERVVIVGWSGGGPLAAFYQAQAERPTIVDTPAGDPVDVAGARLIPGDALIFQAASVSRARILVEALDPSVRNELNPDDRDPRLDPYQTPRLTFPPAFLEEYRAAQYARMRRITAWVESTLHDLKRRNGKEMERGFVVHRTMADPRYLDPLVDPNDRRPYWCLSGEPETANTGPVGFARFNTLRSWLSQWSIDHSRADAAACVANIRVPFLAIENTADDGAPAQHMKEVAAACRSPDKEYAVVRGANHYYAGQPELLLEACQITQRFLQKRGLCDT